MTEVSELLIAIYCFQLLCGCLLIPRTDKKGNRDACKARERWNDFSTSGVVNYWDCDLVGFTIQSIFRIVLWSYI